MKLITWYIDTKEKKEVNIPKFHRIMDVNYLNRHTLVISAISRGQSDIYTYHIPTTRLERITNDFYDDLQPAYINLDDGHEGILFISNRVNDTLRTERLDTTLPTGNFDVFFYDYKFKSNKLVRLTHTPLVNEHMPMQYNENHISYLSEQNGISNRFVGYFDTVFSHFDTVVYDTVYTYPPADSTASKARSRDLAFDAPAPYPEHSGSGIDTNYLTKLVAVYKETAISFPETNYETGIIEQDID
ncbi:MAG: hypothetical protein IIA85_01200, partial [Nanoarchaeota archaeon]|nr:hypothetical protein [Nanoarchaeota archaeon]